MVVAPSPGANGSTMVHNVRARDAPSSRAASKIDCGTASKKFLSTHTVKGTCIALYTKIRTKAADNGGETERTVSTQSNETTESDFRTEQICCPRAPSRCDGENEKPATKRRRHASRGDCAESGH
jgi:hypothetical protein